ncbi:hypothetical protein TRFO_19836 [Tritrichomonas foetus]|uniref:Uncharacterized protein n=1 Tax=Tritrichomonas foetus TaxID=1144522 RepID=A0A1J4KN16_9EUKA|nr:hypothetical protein TRFO_19836 [Tritrichomonas foetus]|eukprot:OHT10781.1 hypothetical protein TRFO_19836 [Tritrichomonas foetus]
MIPTKDNKRPILIHEEIRPSDTEKSFYDRVRSFILENQGFKSDVKFLLFVEYRIESLTKMQHGIIEKPIPPDISNIILPPSFVVIGQGNLHNIRASLVIDCGEREECEIDPKTGVKKYKTRKLTKAEKAENLERVSETEGAISIEIFTPKHSKKSPKIDSEITDTNPFRYDLPKPEEESESHNEEEEEEEEGFLHSNQNNYSFILRSLNFNESVDESSVEYNHLVGFGLIEDGELTEEGMIAAQFDDLLLYEYVNLAVFVKSQHKSDKKSGCLFSLLLQQLMRYGSSIINDLYSDSFLQNFDQYSDIVTILKVFLPLIKAPPVEDSKFLRAGLNPEICNEIINFLFEKLTNINDLNLHGSENEDDDELDESDEGNDESGNENDGFEDENECFNRTITRLQKYLSNMNEKITNYFLLCKSYNNDFYASHELIFDRISHDNLISIIMKNSENTDVILSNRPGWNGYSTPTQCFALCIDRVEESTTCFVSLIHSIPVEKDFGKDKIDIEMAVCSFQIAEEHDNSFVSAMLPILIDQSKYLLFSNSSINNIFSTSTSSTSQNPSSCSVNNFTISNTVNHFSFISYCPNDINFDYQRDIKQSLNLISNIIPYVPRSLLYYDQQLSVLIELQSDNVSDLHPLVYTMRSTERSVSKRSRRFHKTTDDEENKDDSEEAKKDGDKSDNEIPELFLPPSIYSITRQSITFLSHHTDEMKGHMPPYRFAITADEFIFKGEDIGNSGNRRLNQKIIALPTVGIGSIHPFDTPSHIVILSDEENEELGQKLVLTQFIDETEQIMSESCSAYLPETAKVFSNSIAYIVNLKNSFFGINSNFNGINQYLMSIYESRNSFIDGNGKILSSYPNFLGLLEVFLGNDDVVFALPKNRHLFSHDDTGTRKPFDFESIKRGIVSNLNALLDHEAASRNMEKKMKYILSISMKNCLKNSDINISIREIGSFCFFIKLKTTLEGNELAAEKNELIKSAIINATRRYGDVEISNPYKLMTFVFPVEKHKGVTVKERYEKVKSVADEFSLYCFDDPIIKKSSQSEGRIEVDVISSSAWIPFAKKIKKVFANDVLTSVLHIPLPHPAMLFHEKTRDEINHWLASNTTEATALHDEDSLWVGKVDVVNHLNKKLKDDINKKNFRFEYYPTVVSLEKFRKIKKKFEERGFLDYEYYRQYNLLIMKPSDIELFKIDEVNLTPIDENLFCLAICGSSIPFVKRMAFYDDSGNTSMLSICSMCASQKIKEATRTYFSLDDLFIDPSNLVKDYETLWKPLKLFRKGSGYTRNKSIPLGQYIWYLMESNSDLIDHIRAWVNAAFLLAKLQCPMIVFCPEHLNQMTVIYSNSKNHNNHADDIKCNVTDCGNVFHTKCLRWHKKGAKCPDEIGPNESFCPGCNYPAFNFFGCNLMICQRCKCRWCYRCKKVFEAKSIEKHMIEEHGGLY